ncbi:MAG: CdaR family protein [Lachnospiraceae bacterium]|nr:CdaR family protein [Lachnospiraceae bacterium]
MKDFLNTLKEKFQHNLVLKIMSIVAAVFLWMYITNTNDPYETVTFYDVPVQILNEDKLIQKDKIVEVLDGSKITVSIEARRSICNALTGTDINAVADFDKTSLTSTVPIEVSVEGYTEKDVKIIRGLGEHMKLSLEDYASKEFKVTIETAGTPAEGYVVDNAVASPNVITVSGSKMQLSRIQEVVVTVNVDSLSGTSTINLKPVVFDMNDDVIAGDKLNLSSESVQVTTSIYPVQKINVFAYPQGECAYGYEYNSLSSYPDAVMIAGKPEEIAALIEENGNLRAYIDITDTKQDVEKNIDMNSLIDQEKYPSVHVMGNDTNLAVKASITEWQTKEIMISPEDVGFLNEKESFSYEIRSFSTRKIRVKATKGWLAGLTASSLRPTIDFSKIDKAGLITMPVNLGSFEGMQILDEVTVTVLVAPNTSDK